MACVQKNICEKSLTNLLQCPLYFYALCKAVTGKSSSLGLKNRRVGTRRGVAVMTKCFLFLSNQSGPADPALVPSVCGPAGDETQVLVEHLPVDWICRRAGPDQGEATRFWTLRGKGLHGTMNSSQTRSPVCRSALNLLQFNSWNRHSWSFEDEFSWLWWSPEFSSITSIMLTFLFKKKMRVDMKSDIDIHAPQRMNCTNFDKPLTFYIGWKLHFLTLAFSIFEYSATELLA